MDLECQESQYQNIYWLKLAVAVAILRSKPAGMSALKYTENIQAKYVSSQSLLRDQYDEAKMSIKQLQQKLTSSSVQDIDMSRSTLFSQKAEATSSSRKINDQISSLAASSQTSGICDSRFKQEKMAKADHSLLAACVISDDCREVSMLENHKFMHSMIELQGLARQGPGLETERFLEAAVTHIHTLRTVIDRDVMILSDMVMCKGAESVMALTDSIPWVGEQPEFMQEVCSLVECIINKMVQSSTYGQSQALRQKRAFMNMLLVFMKGKTLPLLSSLLESLVESVEIFCQKLQTSQLLAEALDPDLFENGYFIIHCLELTMKIWTSVCHLHTTILQEAQTKLDRALMQITHCFPLVAQALLRITSLIEAILQKR